MTFTSTSFEKVDDESYRMTGNLNIRGIEKPVTLNVEVGGFGKDPWATPRVVSPSAERSTARSGDSTGMQPSKPVAYW